MLERAGFHPAAFAGRRFVNDSQLQRGNPVLAWLKLILLAICVLLTGGVAAYLALRGTGSSERLAFAAGGASEGLDPYCRPRRTPPCESD